MEVKELHSWNVDTKEAKKIQKKLTHQTEFVPFNTDTAKTVAGIDVSMRRGDRTIHAAIVVMDIETLKPVEEAWATVEETFPYVPRYLSFREGPAVMEAWKKLKAEPDVVLFDGQGFAHPLRFGLACHLGLWINVPSIGVAKKKLVGEYEDLSDPKWSLTPLMDGIERIGTVLRSRENVKPIFISPGHLMDVHSSVDVVRLTLDKFRLPEPSRAAHKLCNRVRKEKL